MKTEIYKHIEVLVNRYPVLNSVKDEIVEAYFLLVESYKNEGKLLIAGNGGSAADAEHIVGELMKGFKLPRKLNENFTDKLISENEELGTVLAESLQGALPAIALDGHPALSTAYMNDCELLLCFAQQVNGYDKDYYYFNDPWTNARTRYSKSLVNTRYNELGKQAVVMVKK